MENQNQINTDSVNQNQIYKIYKISSSQTNQVYIGITPRKLSIRLCEHRYSSKYKNIRNHCRSYLLLTNFDDCKIDLIEEVNKTESKIRERYWIDFYGENCVNVRKPGRIITQEPEYRIQLEIKNKEKMICECGAEIRKDSKFRHIKTNKHKLFFNTN